jgi:glutamyl/glutaminyl-tRNA synthetase
MALPTTPTPLPPAPEGGWPALVRRRDDDQEQQQEVGRFAPSTTGPAHPGTLLAALLAWLDARSRGARFALRLEDLDPERCSPQLARQMEEDLQWLGLDWDGDADVQSAEEAAAGHAAALDWLESKGRLYACACSRSIIKKAGRRAPDGGWAYSNTCRPRDDEDALPPPSSSSSWREWRAKGMVVRARLPDGLIEGLADEADQENEGGPASSSPPLANLSQDPSHAFGDPVVIRRDGAVAYMLAVVVDDAVRARATRVVRGRDIAPSTATQVALQRLLGLDPPPAYRHHLLLLEPAAASSADGAEGTEQDRDDTQTDDQMTKMTTKKKKKKLAKLHGSVGAPRLRAAGLSGADVVGFLARVSGLRDTDAPVTPRELLAEGFSWSRVRREDQVVGWDGKRLIWLGGADVAADEEEEEEDEKGGA